MHDDKDFPMDADLGGDEIEIEFVDEDTDVTSVVEQPQEAEVLDDPSPQEGADDLKTELEHVREMYLRKLAEFDNFRKRVDRERGVDRQAGVEELVRDLLPVLDNFERALEHSDSDAGAVQQGVEMIAWPELGTEALTRMELDEFPAYVAIDVRGTDVYETAPAKWRAKRGDVR